MMLTRRRGKSSAVVVAEILSTEGFTEYTANQIKRYWNESVKHPRHAGRLAKTQRNFSAMVQEKLSEGDKLILGRFISLMQRQAFDTGVRIGLTAFLHGARIEDTGELE